MLNITNYYGNANPNHNKILLQANEGDYYIKNKTEQKIPSIVKDLKKLEPVCIAGGNVKQCSHPGNQCSGSSKNSTQNYHGIQPHHF